MVPLVASIVIALGGIFLAWLVYGRRPLQAGQQDPLERWLGPIHTVLRHKYYFDELYQAIVVAFTLWLSRVSFRFDDRWIIDPIVDGVGRLGRWVSTNLRRFIDEGIIDNAVNGTGFIANVTGGVLRLMQTGQAQNYLLVLLITVLVLLGVAQFL